MRFSKTAARRLASFVFLFAAAAATIATSQEQDFRDASGVVQVAGTGTARIVMSRSLFRDAIGLSIDVELPGSMTPTGTVEYSVQGPNGDLTDRAVFEQGLLSLDLRRQDLAAICPQESDECAIEIELTASTDFPVDVTAQAWAAEFEEDAELWIE
jgi:hypothetical protein